MVSRAGAGHPACPAYHQPVIVAVDVGNSALKLAIVDGADVLDRTSLPTAGADPAMVAARIERLQRERRARPTVLALASVVEGWTGRLVRIARELGMDPLVADAASIPIVVGTAQPERTGPDRIIAAWAAMVLRGAPVLVVDLGTATTVDAVDRDGVFRGGAIMPGLELSLRALASGTDRLPDVRLAEPAWALGDDTSSAMLSGVVLGQLGAIRELATRMRLELDEDDAPFVASGRLTGEDWLSALLMRPFGPGLPAVVDAVDPDLVLRGLGLLAERMLVRPG
jgi:type III pantothenate kinase